MALSANTVFEIRSTATAGNLNGGGFVTGASGTDFSQQDAAQYNLTSVTTAGADAILLHASAAADMVGNLAHIISGTNFTAGWYEIISVSAGVSITLDRTCTTGAGASGVVNIGGALSLASTLDDDCFELAPTGGGVKYWIKSGTYVLGEQVNIGTAGGSLKPNKVEGYASARGDKPTGSTRPLIDAGSSFMGLGQAWEWSYIQFTGTASPAVSTGSDTKVRYCKFMNTSLTSGRAALGVAGIDCLVFNCEATSHNGAAITANSSGVVDGCYLHSSVSGFATSSLVATLTLVNNLIIGNKTAAIDLSSTGQTTIALIRGNTLFGFVTPTGTGLLMETTSTNIVFTNNIVSGFVTGVSHGATQTMGFDDFNDYYNNTTNATNWTLGPNSVTTNPSFASVAQLSGTTATTSGSVLTQSGGDFSTVTDGYDYVYLISGTGVTVALYKITGHTGTTLTLDVAPGTNATTDKAWRILTSKNFATGATLTGSPTVFGNVTTANSNIGATRSSASSGGGVSGNKLGFGAFS